MKNKIIIIGAWPGWLTAWMLLASRWFDVEIHEKNSSVGWRNSSINEKGFSFDVWPTFLMMKFILDEVFSEAWEKSEDYIDFIKLDPMYHLYFKDKKIDISDDKDKMNAEIKKNFPWNEAWFEDFLKKEKVRFEKLYKCLNKPYTKFSSFFHSDFLNAIPYFSIPNSMYTELGKYFNENDLKISFTFQSKYLWMSPWECPAAFMMIPYIEHAFWIYHTKWWLSKISEAMAEVFIKKWWKLKLSSNVKQIITEGNIAKWIITTSDEKILADKVIINSDFAYSMDNLVEKWVLKKYSGDKLKKKKYSCSIFMLYLWLDKIYDEIGFHNIFFSNDYKKFIKNVFWSEEMIEDISFYIRNASILDNTVAPEWKSALYILVPVQNKKIISSWMENKKSFRDLIINSIKEKTPLKDIDKHIEFEKIISPDEWEWDYNVFYWATFNLAHSLNQMLYFRPRNKFEEIENCYLVWWWTHPGSGLPTIYESGRITANIITEELK